MNNIDKLPDPPLAGASRRTCSAPAEAGNLLESFILY